MSSRSGFASLYPTYIPFAPLVLGLFLFARSTQNIYYPSFLPTFHPSNLPSYPDNPVNPGSDK